MTCRHGLFEGGRLSIGFEIEIPSVRILGQLGRRSGTVHMSYNELKGFPLFHTVNRRIKGVIEYNGSGHVSLLELVTEVDENPYQEAED